MSDSIIRRNKHLAQLESFFRFVKVLDLLLFSLKSCLVSSDVINPEIENLNLFGVKFLS